MSKRSTIFPKLLTKSDPTMAGSYHACIEKAAFHQFVMIVFREWVIWHAFPIRSGDHSARRKVGVI
jgi:hypothetical protein